MKNTKNIKNINNSKNNITRGIFLGLLLASSYTCLEAMFVLQDVQHQGLMEACRCGYLDQVNRILLENSDIEINRFHMGFTALCQASVLGYLEIVERLLAHPNIDINKSNQGTKALCLASMFGKLEVVKRLITVPGLNVNTSDHQSITPLQHALDNGHTKIADLLRAQVDGSSTVDRTDMGSVDYFFQDKNFELSPVNNGVSLERLSAIPEEFLPLEDSKAIENWVSALNSDLDKMDPVTEPEIGSV